MSADGVHVRIGECFVAAENGMLYSIGLGSCVAVALYDARARVVGLGHVMLPEIPGRNGHALGRYAPTAIPLLVERMVEAGARKRGMTARIVGGASMFAEALPIEGLRLGERNVTAVKQALALAGVPIVAAEVGGTFGRSVYLNAADGSLLVRAVRRADIVL